MGFQKWHSNNFCLLLTRFANSLDPDQASHFDNIPEKLILTAKSMQNYLASIQRVLNLDLHAPYFGNSLDPDQLHASEKT